MKVYIAGSRRGNLLMCSHVAAGYGNGACMSAHFSAGVEGNCTCAVGNEVSTWARDVGGGQILCSLVACGPTGVAPRSCGPWRLRGWAMLF